MSDKPTNNKGGALAGTKLRALFIPIGQHETVRDKGSAAAPAPATTGWGTVGVHSINAPYWKVPLTRAPFFLRPPHC